MARTCYYTNEGFAQRVDGRVVYQLALIEEGAPGYRVTHTDENLSVVQKMAQEKNESAGLSETDVLDIVIGSMAAGPVSR